MIKNFFRLFVLAFSFQLSCQMKITKLFPESFDKNTPGYEWKAMPVEESAYKLLSNKPLGGDIHYLAAPWYIITRTGRLNKISTNLKIPGGFTVCQGVDCFTILPILRRIGIRVAFLVPLCHSQIGKMIANRYGAKLNKGALKNFI